MGYKRVLEGEARQCVQLVKVGAAAEINLEFAQQRESRQTRERAENFSSSAPYLMVGFINFL